MFLHCFHVVGSVNLQNDVRLKGTLGMPDIVELWTSTQYNSGNWVAE